MPVQDVLPTGGPRPDSPEEAAKAFEKVLVRRFVKTMTNKMFDSTLSGKDGPSWMQGQRDHQRDLLTDVLADHIVDANALGISEMLLRDWGLTPEQSGSESPLERLPSRPPHIAAQID